MELLIEVEIQLAEYFFLSLFVVFWANFFFAAATM